MDILKQFDRITNIIYSLSKMSFNSTDEITENMSNLCIQNCLKEENNNEDFILNFDFINNILFLDEQLENKYKIFFQYHLHMISNEETIFNNYLSVLITYYNLLLKLINSDNLDLLKENMPYDMLKDILEYINVLNDNVLFDTNDTTYNDLDNIRKIMISRIEFLVHILIDKLKNCNEIKSIKEYQDIIRIFFNTIQMIIFVLYKNY